MSLAALLSACGTDGGAAGQEGFRAEVVGRGVISTEGHDTFPMLSPDGSTMFFM